MTDSMKFGPEWLRNMSSDPTSCNAVNTTGQITNSNGAFGSGSNTSGNDAGNNNSLNITATALHNNINVSNSGASRNTFPEFRYGREEMLLLFDRNCIIPEILPSYKNLFVERAQFPLALVPSTDEEMMQGSAPSMQRPGWLQRSPIAFSTATRGTGRVGCMERGRVRGKSIYHPVFQRSNAMFDEDQRSTSIKSDRSWAERNGGSGDSLVAGSSTIAVGNVGPDVWNGSTPVSSPRRDFSNHPRNMENWRRTRNEDGSGTDLSITPFSADSGWRMNTSGFQNSHSRWSRSTSWRDDDLSSNENSNTVVSGSGSTIVGGSSPMMLRSNSTITTLHADKVCPNKGTGGSPGAMRTTSTRNSVSGYIWPINTAVGQMPNNQCESNTTDDVSLPEWAMENPSDVGGTFDATGAFHGAIDDQENSISTCNKQENDAPPQLSSKEKLPSEVEEQDILCNFSNDSSIKSTISHKSFSIKETENSQDSSSPSPTPSSAITASQDSTELLDEYEKSKHNNAITYNTDTTIDLVNSQNAQNSSEARTKNDYITQNAPPKIFCRENNITNNNSGDYAERMMKVTDDMIEKLIMDDEDNKDDHIKSSLSTSGNKMNSQNLYMHVQQQQNSSHQQTASPALSGSTGSTGPPNMSVYNIGGMLVDHTHNMNALNQLQHQQMAAVAAVAIGLQPTSIQTHPITSSASSDLWLYRDPQAKVQGPFSALEMTEWYRAGYFNENLFVRRVCDVHFWPLGELIKICNGQMPFSHSHLIPVDLNPSALTPPLPHVIPTQPSPHATDFLMKTLNEHQQRQQREKLKGNVTAAAESLTNALKNVVNSVDISQVLNMQFQTLQDRFIHSQEIEIINELSKNECFRCLSSTEQDAIVGQKLQTLGLPEYLTNLAGLSNSLAVLNPSAGSQLYDTIAECAKENQVFNNHQGPSQLQSTTQQQQQRNNHHVSSSSTPYINPDDFIMKIKKPGHDVNSSGLLSEFNLRIFSNNRTHSGAGCPETLISSNTHAHELLNNQQLFSSGSNATPNTSTNTPQSPMMQMWMNSLAAHQTTSLTNQHSLMTNAPQATESSNQWLNGPLVGISSISLPREQHIRVGNLIGSPKNIPISMWDVATLEHHVQVQQQQKQDQQVQLHMQQQTFDHLEQETNKKKDQDENGQQLLQQRNVVNELKTSNERTTNVSSTYNTNKQEQQNQSQQQFISEKPHSHLSNNKRNSTSNNNTSKLSHKCKNENLVEQLSKKSEEERRREQNEEKRRLKEERKRQHIEEEKRRITQAEDEKRRQMQEEEKRQQQIQAQRRKALMSNTNNNNTSGNNNENNISSNSETTAIIQRSKEQRIQSSVAPWSTQIVGSKSQGPGLAEIQKAERRERRADQQRQLEIHEKQLRALALSNEVQDNVLKWNSAPVPVKSFAEIQAEEAKRLALEQMEVQRRKEQEAQNNLVAFNANNTVIGGINSSSNISSIWSGNKIWGTSTTTNVFWEDTTKSSSKPVCANLSNSNLTIAATVSQSSNLLHKSATAQHQQPQPQMHCSTQLSSNKNIKKSQTVAIMQNTTVSPPSAIPSGGPYNQKKASNNVTPVNKQSKQTKAENNNIIATVSGNIENKKNTAKNIASTKNDDFETEFTNWCTKSLNNMNAKVDVPTFVSFLRDLESPYEVKDYIRMYLGESKEYIDFAKQFLERRSKCRNLQRAQNAHDDDLCKPAQAITPWANENNENKGRQKKVKKNKMTKLDARILGFSVTAAEGRINVGDRDYGDAS